MAQEIGVSTTPLREALRRLASEGMVQLESHRDARVTPLTADEARDLYLIRESLDPMAAGLAAAGRTDADIAGHQGVAQAPDPPQRRRRPGGDDGPPRVPPGHLHRLPQPPPHRHPRGALGQGGPLPAGGLHSQKDSAKDRARVQKEHEEIADAVIAGDADRARESMQRHVVGSLGRRAIGVLETA